MHCTTWKYWILTSFLFVITSCVPSNCIECLNTNGQTLRERISPPTGYERMAHNQSSWKGFLQNLELLEHDSKILDYRGKAISSQSSHIAIVNYDVGNKDLQQCADAVIRLRSEYLFEQNRFDDIQFKFTSGHNYMWSDHADGIRPIVNGSSVTFRRKAEPSNTYENFRKYLEIVFMYAGTISLNRDLLKIARKQRPEIGDIIIKPGSPGHAVLIVDRAKNAQGNYAATS